jgi:hypothetical protein
MKNDFSTIDIQRALKIPRERFRQWLDMGFIKPSVQAAGAGTRASFTRTDVYRIAVFDYLITRGFKRGIAARFVEMFGRNAEDSESNYLLLRRESGKTGFIVLTSRHWQADLEGGTFYPAQDAEMKRENSAFRPSESWDDIFIVNFAKIRTQVDRSLGE